MNTLSRSFIGWEMQYDENGHSYGQLVTGNFITTMCPLTHHVSCRGFGKTWNHSGDSAPLQPRFGALRLLAFPQIKIIFEREEISNHQWDSRKYYGAADRKSCEKPNVPTLKGTEASLSCIQCFLYFVSSSINVSIFHIVYLGTFWTDLYIYI